MVSVTARVNAVKQPRGGYINPAVMKCQQLDDGSSLGEESISPSTMGMVVDYMTRFTVSGDAKKSFRISISGAIRGNYLDKAIGYLNKVVGDDDVSIQNACRLVWYDTILRTGKIPSGSPEDIHADAATCENVRIMVGRSLKFFEAFGPVVADGIGFPGGYSKVVNSGDGDFVTKDTLWDFKVSKNPPTKENTLQLAMYYIMAKRSICDWAHGLDKIGIFNPRLNRVYILEMGTVSQEVIESIKHDVLCYD